jgi:hypothetical protein
LIFNVQSYKKEIMKLRKITGYLAGAFMILSFNACTDLTETVYDKIMTVNYYNTKDDVIRATFRPFEHSFCSIGSRQVLNELTADQLGTWERNGWWLDNQVWQYLHYHTWAYDHNSIKSEWENCFKGIMQANSVLDDFKSLDPAKFGMTKAELDAFAAQNRTLRAWLYIRVLDAFRNVPLAISTDQSKNSIGQVSPQELFTFLEKELKESIEDLPAKTGSEGNLVNQGQWTKAGAAALLMRLYLNAEKWIGTAKYTECADYAQKIINGDFGNYSISSTWDEVFDWKNENCSEVIFAFPSAYGQSNWHYSGDTYWWATPVNARFYLGAYQQGDFNTKYAVQPSYDLNNKLYDFKFGKFISKFKKYPEDYRLKMYKNLGNSTREGMFLFGYLEYKDAKGDTKKVKAPVGGYEIYIRDQVGVFNELAPGKLPVNRSSTMAAGDHNSGWHFIKYPIYRDDDEGKKEADYVEIRLAEVYYTLAECKFRAGDVTGAAKLLNTVRKRNYPESKYAEYLYKPEGSVDLTEIELLDEWGREFLAEGRRRTDLIRWNKFCTERWWDKEPDTDNHTEIFPIPRDMMGADRNLVQNPGYEN